MSTNGEPIPLYRSHDERPRDDKNRPLKLNTATGRMVIDTNEAEAARQSAIKHEHKIRQEQLGREEQQRLTDTERKAAFYQLKSITNQEYHEQLERDRAYWLNEDARRLDIWTTTDASAFFSSLCHKYISPSRVRGWAARGWIEYERDTSSSRYIFRAVSLVKLWKELLREVGEKPELVYDAMVRIHAQQHELGTFAPETTLQ